MDTMQTVVRTLLTNAMYLLTCLLRKGIQGLVEETLFQICEICGIAPLSLCSFDYGCTGVNILNVTLCKLQSRPTIGQTQAGRDNSDTHIVDRKSCVDSIDHTRMVLPRPVVPWSEPPFPV